MFQAITFYTYVWEVLAWNPDYVADYSDIGFLDFSQSLQTCYDRTFKYVTTLSFQIFTYSTFMIINTLHSMQKG